MLTVKRGKIYRRDGETQRKIYLTILSISFVILFNSCTAILSTTNSVGSSVSALFSSPVKVENKIIDPVLPESRLAVLWIGHAAVLIQIDDKFILTDPVFTETTAFISKRLIEPGIEPENLPEIDAALISHLHSDHLSFGSLDMIESKVKELIVPQGGLVYIPNYDFEMNELKRWQTWQKDGLKITAVPVLHNGFRYGLDEAWMKTSYTGYVIQYNGINVYFGGDTGYDSTTTIFKETGERFPNIDLAILPIAPIHPREYSNLRHTDPHDAIEIYFELNADRLMPIHFDTFPESYDTLGEAENLMKAEMIKSDLSDEDVLIFKIGEQKNIISTHRN